MKLQRPVVVVLITLVWAFVFLGESYLNPPERAFYNKFAYLSDVTPDEINQLQTILSAIAEKAGDFREININGKFDKKALNVAFIDFKSHKYNNIDLPDEGFISFPPNILIVDIGSVRGIELMAFNDGLGLVQGLTELEGKRSSSDSDSEMEKYGAISMQLRLRNFSNWEAANSAYVPLIVKNLKDTPLKHAFYYPFIFPIAHELYHLRSPALMRRINPTDEEESEADRFALSVVKNVIGAELGPDSRAVDVQLMISGLRYFQDKILERVFRGFRGLEADALLTALYHAPCATMKPIPWPRRFNNPDVVVIGMYRPFPILSDIEVSRIASRLEKFSSSTHENLLLRIIRVAELIESDEGFRELSEGIFKMSRYLYDIYLERHAKRDMFFPSSAFGPPGPVPTSVLVDHLGGKPEVVSAEGCDNGNCVLAQVGEGYVEIYGSSEHIQLVNLAQPPTPKGLEMLKVAASEIISPTKAESLINSLTSRRSECGAASVFAQTDSYTVLVRTMNPEGWYEFQAISNPE